MSHIAHQPINDTPSGDVESTLEGNTSDPSTWLDALAEQPGEMPLAGMTVLAAADQLADWFVLLATPHRIRQATDEDRRKWGMAALDLLVSQQRSLSDVMLVLRWLFDTHGGLIPPEVELERVDHGVDEMGNPREYEPSRKVTSLRQVVQHYDVLLWHAKEFEDYVEEIYEEHLRDKEVARLCTEL